VATIPTAGIAVEEMIAATIIIALRLSALRMVTPAVVSRVTLDVPASVEG
jgi:hypothetical protein